MPFSMCFSMADQNFAKTKSLGILNQSWQLAECLSQQPESVQLTVLGNHSLQARPELAAATIRRDYDYAIRSRPGRIWWDQIGCYTAARQSGAEWLFLPKGFASFTRRPPGKLAVYVHDTMHAYYAQHYPGSFTGLESWYFAKALQATIRWADIIFTNSDFARGEVLRLAETHGLRAPRVVRGGIGFAPNAQIPMERRERLVVLVSRWPHKRSEQALAWLERWREEAAWAGELHVVGSLPEGVNRPATTAWHWHARLEDRAYEELLRQARALVYFTEYEGFGMPPVEAARVGACPVFSAVPATMEVMAGCGCPFRNDDYASFAEAMRRALATSAKTIHGWSKELLRRHSWAEVTRKMLQALEEER